MSKRLFKTMAAVLAIAAAAAGPVRGQNASPDVTLDFTTNTWDFPAGKSNITYAANSYTSGDYTITLQGGGGSGNGYYFNSNYLLLGKSGAYLQLPAFESAVDSIVVVGKSGGSASVLQNIYVGETAVSTQTTGTTGTNTYVIDANYRAAGNIYTLKVESSANTQITYIKVYCSTPPTPHTVRMAEGTEDAANWTLASGNASVPGNQVLENVMSGSQVTATYNGTTKKVKSVKAVKYVPPAATVATVPTATAAVIEVGSTAALVNAGAASGGSMMYAVTATNAQPASTADFSASIPTAEGRTAGTYYVWFYAKADAEHSDGEIAGPVSVTVAVMATVTWNSSNVFNSGHQDDMLNKWNTTPLTYEGITISFSGNGTASSFHAYDSGNQTGELKCFGQSSDSFTFTAPSGKKFVRIEMANAHNALSSDANWIEDGNKLVWSGTPSNTVEIAGDGLTQLSNLNTIVFKLIDD